MNSKEIINFDHLLKDNIKNNDGKSLSDLVIYFHFLRLRFKRKNKSDHDMTKVFRHNLKQNLKYLWRKTLNIVSMKMNKNNNLFSNWNFENSLKIPSRFVEKLNFFFLSGNLVAKNVCEQTRRKISETR